jgi:N-acetylglucosamine-6-phosphate deacetylase
MKWDSFVGRNALGEGGIRVSIEGDRIAEISAIDDPGRTAPWIGPGLIDLQVNGHDHGDANAIEPAASQIEAMSESLSRRGIVRFLPTVITGSPAQMLARIRAIVDARLLPLSQYMVAGIHIEGPFLSPEDGPRGVHALEHIRAPEISELTDWVSAAEGLLKVVTLSPHYEWAATATRFLVQHGVTVSIGHTHADNAQIAAVVDAGATLSTHLGNGAHAMLPRHPNYIWTQLAERRLSAGVIADGHHLPDSVLSAIIAAKRDHGVFLVSDCVATPAQLHADGHSSVGGNVQLADDGALRHVATGFLAGSIQTLDVGVATAARVTGSLARGVALATTAPARILGLNDVWRVGGRADLMTFRWRPGDRAIEPETVVIAGRAVSMSPVTRRRHS